MMSELIIAVTNQRYHKLHQDSFNRVGIIAQQGQPFLSGTDTVVIALLPPECLS